VNTAIIPVDSNDAELAARLRAGDTSAIEGLYWRHAPDLLRLAKGLTGSPEDAEDVVQDVFVGLQRALRHYSESGSFEQWLRRITARVALSKLRSRKHEVVLTASTESRIDPEAEAIANRLSLERAINALPDPLRTVFVLREIEHYSHNEIAQILGIRRGTSEVRLYRAIRILRELLQSER
jgi:RNA polymerase sigma-70 factor (ECF subfamily)